jgi:hypothetical protein
MKFGVPEGMGGVAFGAGFAVIGVLIVLPARGVFVLSLIPKFRSTNLITLPWSSAKLLLVPAGVYADTTIGGTRNPIW